MLKQKSAEECDEQVANDCLYLAFESCMPRQKRKGNRTKEGLRPEVKTQLSP